MSYTRMRYHVVFATKRRAPFISPDVEAFLYPVMAKIVRDLGGIAIRINGIEDHVHLIVALPTSICIDDFVRAVKSRSTGAVRRRFEHLAGFRWQRQFGCFTLNPERMQGIIAYVENQKAHHRRQRLRACWERTEKG